MKVKQTTLFIVLGFTRWKQAFSTYASCTHRCTSHVYATFKNCHILYSAAMQQTLCLIYISTLKTLSTALDIPEIHDKFWLMRMSTSIFQQPCELNRFVCARLPGNTYGIILPKNLGGGWLHIIWLLIKQKIKS